MKNVIMGMVLLVTALSACNTGSNTKTDIKEDTTAGNTKVAPPASEVKDDNTGGAMHEMVGQYLQMKNALANDNGKDAAAAGNAFVASMGKMEKTNMSPDKVKKWDDLSDDAKEMAGHIGMNGAKLDHQREHFDMLSKDMYDMVKTFGAGQTLYQDFCPMYNNKKGASWLSESKDIKNPYMGKKMATCGTIKEEIKM